jgi:hypothetical protein
VCLCYTLNFWAPSATEPPKRVRELVRDRQGKARVRRVDLQVIESDTIEAALEGFHARR